LCMVRQGNTQRPTLSATLFRINAVTPHLIQRCIQAPCACGAQCGRGCAGVGRADAAAARGRCADADRRVVGAHARQVRASARPPTRRGLLAQPGSGACPVSCGAVGSAGLVPASAPAWMVLGHAFAIQGCTVKRMSAWSIVAGSAKSTDAHLLAGGVVGCISCSGRGLRACVLLWRVCCSMARVSPLARSTNLHAWPTFKRWAGGPRRAGRAQVRPGHIPVWVRPGGG